MGNIQTYLKWRGDITFEERQFNEIDNLILSALAYIDLDGIVPSINSGGSISVENAADLFMNGNKPHDVERAKRLAVVDNSLLNDMASSVRFKNAKLSNYEDTLDEEKQTQFAAIYIELDDGTVYIAYRGTDNSILGWREDFTMGFQLVPAQQLAFEYLQATVTDKVKKYRIGGHSKGGNLAMYAAMMCEDSVRDLILNVYNNDGPGFCKELPYSSRYELIQDKLIKIIPEFSVIGTLFEHEKPYKIIGSSAEGLIQHHIMTWDLEGDQLVEKPGLTARCKMMNELFNRWIEDVDMEQRQTFTKEFFDSLGAGGSNLVTEIASGGIDGFESILVSIGSSDISTKTAIGKLIKSATASFKKIDFREVVRTQNMKRGIFFLILGLFFMATPEFALSIIGGIFFVAILVYAGIKLVLYIKKIIKDGKAKLIRLGIYVFLIGLASLFLIKNNYIFVPASLALGVTLIANAYLHWKRVVGLAKQRPVIGGVLLINALISFLFGIVTVVLSRSVNEYFVLYAGIYLSISGSVDMIAAMYENARCKW